MGSTKNYIYRATKRHLNILDISSGLATRPLQREVPLMFQTRGSIFFLQKPRLLDNELNKKYSVVSLYSFGWWKVRDEKLARSRHFSVKRHTSSQVAVRRDRAVFKKRISMQHAAQSHVVFTAHSKREKKALQRTVLRKVAQRSSTMESSFLYFTIIQGKIMEQEEEETRCEWN